MQKEYTYEIFYVDGDYEKLVLPHPMELEQMQELVGGDIELVAIMGKEDCLIVNENGINLRLEQNPIYKSLRGTVVKGYVD